MTRLASLKALEILDSRGVPTLEVTAITDDGFDGVAAVPSGASTGMHEAVELRDHDQSRYLGKGVTKAVHFVEQVIFPHLQGLSIFDQDLIDQTMIKLDGTVNKSHLGANSLLGVSLAVAKARANRQNLELYEILDQKDPCILPIPLMNVINGGAHADNPLEIQEFMIKPVGAPSFREAIRWGSEVFYSLKKILQQAGHVVSVGDEGGFAPQLHSHEMALDFLVTAIEQAGYLPGKDVAIALDCAASEYYDPKTHTYLGMSPQAYHAYLEKLCRLYPICSVEDPFDQNDWTSWQEFTQTAQQQIVGDDIFVTNPVFLIRGIQEKTANAILIKPNQIGTLTETLHTIRLAKKADFRCIISHRSGETEDTTIADLAVATHCGQIKTGSLTRSERVAKYNRLLKIEQLLGTKARFGN